MREYGLQLQTLEGRKYRVRLTSGGDKINYNHKTASPTANLIDTKILTNSTISDVHKGTQFMIVDIKDFLMTPFLKNPREYMIIHGTYFDQ